MKLHQSDDPRTKALAAHWMERIRAARADPERARKQPVGFLSRIVRPKQKKTPKPSAAARIAEMERRLAGHRHDAVKAHNQVRMEICRLQVEGRRLFRQLTGH